MRVVGYIRVSTEEQSQEGASLEAQRERLTRYAAARKLDLVGVEEDAGVSAKTLKRPALARALALLKAGGADGLLIPKLDRLTRSVVGLGQLIEEYFGEKGGYQLLSVADSINTAKANGRMFLNFLTTVAQWEREVICERTQEVIDHKRGKGERIGTVPYGFALDREDPRRSKSGRPVALVIEPGEAEGLSLIARLHAEGKSLRRIAGCLQALGYPTWTGTPWRHTTIVRILARAS